MFDIITVLVIAVSFMVGIGTLCEACYDAYRTITRR